MPIRKNVFIDTKFNEWLFDKLVNLNADQTKNLNHSELRVLRSKTAIKQFVLNENLERKLSILTKLGMQWNLSFWNIGTLDKNILKKTYKQYSTKGLTVENVESMSRQKVFVINSRDMALSMSLMSLNCHSEIYVINPGFMAFKKTAKTVGANISVAKTMSASNQNIEHLNVSRETKNMAKVGIELGCIDNYLSGVLNLKMVDMLILWFLYTVPYNFVSVEAIKRALHSKYKPGTIGARAAYLFRDRRMIDKRPSAERTPHYIIMQEGIITVGLVNNHIVNSVYGN